MEKITEEFLKEQGFIDSGEKHGNNIIWRKSYRNIGFFTFVMGDYLETNPNIGVLGIYYPEEMIPSVPDDLLYKEDWTEEDKERAANHKIKVEEYGFNFAFYLDNQDRFIRLIDDISYERN